MDKENNLNDELRDERAHSGNIQRQLDHVRFLFLQTSSEVMIAEDEAINCSMLDSAQELAEKNGITDENESYPQCHAAFDAVDILDFEDQLKMARDRLQYYDEWHQNQLKELLRIWASGRPQSWLDDE